MKKLVHYFVLASFLALAISCGKTAQKESTNQEADKLAEFFEAYYQGYLERHPMLQTKVGANLSNQWGDLSDKAELQEVQILKDQLAALKKFDYGKLDYTNQTSYNVFKHYAQDRIDGEKFIYHNYPLNQYRGLHTELPAFLIHYQLINTKEDAENYIARVKGFDNLVIQIIKKLKIRKEKGIIAPKFVFPMVTASCKNLLSGQPFYNSNDKSPLFDDFVNKLNKSELDENTKKELTEQLSEALTNEFKTAYTKLMTYWEDLEKSAKDEIGAGTLPNGDAYYEYAVRNATTTKMTPDEIFELGEQEVANSQYLIEELMKKVAFKGNLRDFFKFVRTDAQFIYPSTDKGKQQYISRSIKALEEMQQRVNELFSTLPMARIEVKAVEPYREKSVGLTFNEPASPNGMRPGVYYINTHNMELLPNYYAEVLAFHEGIPGHLFQSALLQEHTKLPNFRKHLVEISAYTEGWGLYSELLPAQMGFYNETYSEFGRLALELFRAARLVVDVGIHYKGWNRQQAIDYMIKNTPNPIQDTEREVDRYIVTPGHATSYYIGMQQIMKLRRKAQKTLGDNYDIKEFHNVVLLGGAVPLAILEESVDGWIAHKKQSK